MIAVTTTTATMIQMIVLVSMVFSSRAGQRHPIAPR
jgi:hypothetical protein